MRCKTGQKYLRGYEAPAHLCTGFVCALVRLSTCTFVQWFVRALVHICALAHLCTTFRLARYLWPQSSCQTTTWRGLARPLLTTKSDLLHGRALPSRIYCPPVHWCIRAGKSSVCVSAWAYPTATRAPILPKGALVLFSPLVTVVVYSCRY